MFDTLLVATDGSKAAEKAVDWAVDFAKRHDSRLIVLNVTPEERVRLESEEPNPPEVDVLVEDAGRPRLGRGPGPGGEAGDSGGRELRTR